MKKQHQTLADYLDSMTAPAAEELVERLDNKAVRCYACAHRCLIREGRRGICQVRFNKDGALYVPFGYAAGIQSDPIEKKPFFHVLPGADALTFGMLGCDMHCSYCFTGDTTVVTQHGPARLDSLFEQCTEYKTLPDGEIGLPQGLLAVSGSGELREVRGIFRHPYRGAFTVIRPYYLPAIRCTPDHRVYATDDPTQKPRLIRADALTTDHFLATPRHHHFAEAISIDVAEILGNIEVSYQVPWKYTDEDLAVMNAAAERGLTSEEIGALFGTTGTNIRHIRRRLARREPDGIRSALPIRENGQLRFPNEHRPGIPVHIPLDKEMARLLGLYCAEGSVISAKDRPNSHTLAFTFALTETGLAQETIELLAKRLTVQAKPIKRASTLAVTVNKASAALLFQELAGAKSAEKRVPLQLFSAPREVVRAFLDAVIDGDGHRYENGKISLTTVSRDLAYGVAWLALKLGWMPAIYESERPKYGTIQGRRVQQAPRQYSVVWYENATVKRKLHSTEKWHLIPIREIHAEPFEGYVYNMEAAEEHNYLANFALVSNCQNWLTSQTLRDEAAGTLPTRVTASQLVDAALRSGAKAVVSSYNEPLITSEWAMAVFKEARKHDLICGYVSNGNATAEVLDYIRPWTQAYKIDLKTMQDKNYRQLGAVLKNILDGIKMVHERGFWLEIVTLLVPGFNDSDEELRDLTGFIASVSPDIPWHVTAFHPDYKMTEPPPTTVRGLLHAAEIGKEAGLRYVYAGNIPGRVGEYENTYCPNCHALLVERVGYHIQSYRITAEGTCPDCGTNIPGIWHKRPEDARLSPFDGWFSRRPRVVRF
ncbi:MAG: radical SAM protein [Chloroflexi bacterium]|nr:radical SAM protein [Chloroflexota bacterium]